MKKQMKEAISGHSKTGEKIPRSTRRLRHPNSDYEGKKISNLLLENSSHLFYLNQSNC